MKKIAAIVTLLTLSCLVAWYTFKKPSPSTTKNDSIIVGTNAEYQPFTFIKDDTIVGLDIDIAREVCKRLGKKMILRDMSFTALIPALQAGNIQFAAAGMTPSPKRAQRVLFTKEYLEGDELLIINLAKNKPLKTIEELKNKEVIVNEGYVSDTYMSKQEGPILIRLANPAAGFLALQSGRGDAFVIARSSAEPFFKQHEKEKFNISPIKDSGNKYALAISKKYPELLEEIQEELDKMSKDETLEKIKSKWGF